MTSLMPTSVPGPESDFKVETEYIHGDSEPICQTYLHEQHLK